MKFIKACKNELPASEYLPFWMMRQAGRYLPEYRKVREHAGDFLTLCRTPNLAAEVTLQPLRRFDIDAAIIFSDILVIPAEMGLNLRFEAGEGPVFASSVRQSGDLVALDTDIASVCAKLSYVYEAISLTRAQLPAERALIGFCGAPWTLATYMIEQGSSKNYAKSKRLVYENPAFMHELLEILAQICAQYLIEQIKAGANAVQIFDSWAGALAPASYLEFGWRYICRIAELVKLAQPDAPVIAFPKGLSALAASLKSPWIDVLGVGWDTPLQLAQQSNFVLQGNLEPCRLYSKNAIAEGVAMLKELIAADERRAAGGQNFAHIFNLGHGILPDIPLENVEYLIQCVRS